MASRAALWVSLAVLLAWTAGCRHPYYRDPYYNYNTGYYRTYSPAPTVYVPGSVTYANQHYHAYAGSCCSYCTGSYHCPYCAYGQTRVVVQPAPVYRGTHYYGTQPPHHYAPPPRPGTHYPGNTLQPADPRRRPPADGHHTRPHATAPTRPTGTRITIPVPPLPPLPGLPRIVVKRTTTKEPEKK
jgi:hypothetical protein